MSEPERDDVWGPWMDPEELQAAQEAVRVAVKATTDFSKCPTCGHIGDGFRGGQSINLVTKHDSIKAVIRREAERGQ